MSFEIASGFVKVTADTSRAVTGLGALTVAAGAAGASLAVLPALGASAAGIGGVIVGAFSGVGAAIKGYQADQKAAAATSAAAAKTEVSNAKQIRDAQQSISDARRNQARVAREAAKAVEEAEKSQSRTARAGAEAIEQASERVEDALDDQREAENRLGDARQQAGRDLEDLREKVSDYAQTQEDASIDVAEAEQKLRMLSYDSTATALDRRRAVNDLAKAQERASDLSRDAARSTAELSAAEAAGVDGSDRVVSARGRLEGAQEKVRASQQELTRTTRDAGEANVAASLRVQEAVERSGTAQEDAALAVGQALQGLRDIQDQQGASAAEAATKNNAYALAMTNLTPAGRAFVEQLLRMGPLVTGLRNTSQSSFLPGLTDMLRDTEGLFPIFDNHLLLTGLIMGDTARRAGDLFATTQFKDNLQGTLDASLPITQAITGGILGIVDAWFSLGASSGPAAVGFASGLTKLFIGMEGFMENLEPHMDTFGILLDAILGGIGKALPGIASGLGFVAQMLLVLGPYILPVIVGFMAMWKVAQVIMAVTTAWRILSLTFALSPFGIVLLAIVGLVGALVTAYATSETFRNVVNSAFGAVGSFIGFTWDRGIRPVFHAIVGGLKWVGENFMGAVRWISDTWGNLRGATSRPINFMIGTVWNNGILRAWNAIAGLLPGIGPIAPLALIPGFRHGGAVRGPGTGTSDDVLMYGSNNEHMWTDREVQAAGGHREVEALRAAALNGTLAHYRNGGPIIPGFAGGGPIYQQLFGLVRGAFPQANLNSGFRSGDPGYHGRGQAVDLGQQGRSGGLGHPYLANMGRWLHDTHGRGLAELIYDGFGDDRPDLLNGRPHTYNANTRGQHRNHVHAAVRSMADLGGGGGILGSIGGAIGGVVSFFRDKVGGIFRDITDPLGGLIDRTVGVPPPAFRGIPKGMFTKFRDAALGFLLGKADGQDAASGAVGLGGYGKGAPFYVQEIARAGRASGVGRAGNIIGVATTIVESMLKMYAN